jgi:SAM-dependent methyltransferase
MRTLSAAKVDRARLRRRISEKYTDVAREPSNGFHFKTGRPLAQMLRYADADMDRLPAGTVESFAGTGNPFSMGALRPGEMVLDIGCGAGFDTLQAAQMVGTGGRVIGVDMTEAMREKMLAGARELDLTNVDVRDGFMEDLPVDDGSIDVVISNGVINLTPDKEGVMREIFRVLKAGGRIQIGDIVVHKEVPQDAKDDIDLWSG